MPPSLLKKALRALRPQAQFRAKQRVISRCEYSGIVASSRYGPASAVGATENSPARQRWEKEPPQASPVGAA